MSKHRIYTGYDNRLVGHFKTLALTPSISISRDTQGIDLGFTSWGISFEWLWLYCYMEFQKERPKAFENEQPNTKAA